MHEVSLVAGLVELVERSAAGRPVETVRVRCATTIPDDVLRQAWTMLTGGGALAAATLDLEPFEIRIVCPCGSNSPVGHDDLVGGSFAVCPSCGELVAHPPTPEIELIEVHVSD